MVGAGLAYYHDVEGEGRDQSQALAKLLYRATLQALPANARSWFTDIKDKRLAASLEVGCCSQAGLGSLSVMRARHELGFASGH